MEHVYCLIEHAESGTVYTEQSGVGVEITVC